MLLVTAAAVTVGLQLRPQQLPADANPQPALAETLAADSAVTPEQAAMPSTAPGPDRSRETPSRRRFRPGAGIAVPEAGKGTFRVATKAALTPQEDAVTTYTVEVERGLPFGVDQVADLVDATLSDPRGWSAGDHHQLRRAGAEASLRILLASPATTDRLCWPLETRGRLSCRNKHLVVLNAWRWANGAEGYERRLSDYRRYVVNHEVGHALGYPHVACPGTARRAPVMLQQTIGLDGCLPNPWPAAFDLR